MQAETFHGRPDTLKYCLLFLIRLCHITTKIHIHSSALEKQKHATNRKRIGSNAAQRPSKTRPFLQKPRNPVAHDLDGQLMNAQTSEDLNIPVRFCLHAILSLLRLFLR